ncbi:SGNH/GDSL hydrolase family protein [Larkinella insperata]|uniref:SGNH/GDSL hydrolase family protein n=1 Tax=Larkinella insperata TaxID=332158 RepID=A0ABW3QEC5_9BACT|nr:GDSL-type esterase/lipase family protein [Larkinella insperata]
MITLRQVTKRKTAFCSSILTRLSLLLIIYTVGGCKSGNDVAPDNSRSEYIIGWGDSLTEGSPSTSTYLTELEKLTGTTYKYINKGISGQTSSQIAERMLADKEKHPYNTIIWAGRNNLDKPEQIKADIASMVAALGHQRYLVLGMINGDFDQNEQVFTQRHQAIMQLNGELYKIYGDHYVNIHAYLLSQYDPSKMQDIIDHTYDVVPASLRVDLLHLNQKGNQKVAERILQSMPVLTRQ